MFYSQIIGIFQTQHHILKLKIAFIEKASKIENIRINKDVKATQKSLSYHRLSALYPRFAFRVDAESHSALTIPILVTSRTDLTFKTRCGMNDRVAYCNKFLVYFQFYLLYQWWSFLRF